MNDITIHSGNSGSAVVLPDIRDIKEEAPQAPRVDRLRYMADLLDLLPDDGRFDLSSWDSCICAWTHHAAGQSHRPLAKLNPIHLARQWLSLPLADATKLFHPDLGTYGDVKPAQAAKVIRHYVDTGKVDWTVAALEGVPKREMQLA